MRQWPSPEHIWYYNYNNKNIRQKNLVSSKGVTLSFFMVNTGKLSLVADLQNKICLITGSRPRGGRAAPHFGDTLSKFGFYNRAILSCDKGR